MRTTLTIEDDVAAELERLRRTRDASLKEVVNEAARRAGNGRAAQKIYAVPNEVVRLRTIADR